MIKYYAAALLCVDAMYSKDAIYSARLHLKHEHDNNMKESKSFYG